MQELVHQLATGVSSGGIYASLALALVMIYRSTGHVNFAQGEMAMFSTFIAWSLLDRGVPYWAAFCLTLAASFIGGVAVERVLIRPMAGRREMLLVTVFLGLFMICNSVADWIWGYDTRPFASPFENLAFLRNPYETPHDLGAMFVTLLVMAGLFGFFQLTRAGLAMRGATENPVSSRLAGVSVDRMSALGWGMATAIGAIAGMMVAPTVFLEPNMMASVLVYGFAGALLGGIDNPWGAVAGGYIVAILENLLGVYVMGKVGDAMMAVRDQPIASAAMGIDNSLLKAKTFGVSAMYTGVAGALGAVAAQYVAPDSFTFMLSISFMVGIVIGGAGTVTGAIYGAMFIGLVPDYASEISKAVPWARYGCCLIACVFLMPDGIHGVVSMLAAKLLPSRCSA
jgi:branched-chain amino acid transport system permease protein